MLRAILLMQYHLELGLLVSLSVAQSMSARSGHPSVNLQDASHSRSPVVPQLCVTPAMEAGISDHAWTLGLLP